MYERKSVVFQYGKDLYFLNENIIIFFSKSTPTLKLTY